MNAIEKFIHILQLEATEPLPYGPYHIFLPFGNSRLVRLALRVLP